MDHVIGKYFLPFCRLSFCFVDGFLCCANILSLIRLYLFIFGFVSFALGDRFNNLLLQFMPKSVLPTFSFRSFMVLGFTFRSLIHFEFIFIYGVRKCSNFILLHAAVQWNKHHYWRDSLFPIVYFYLLCHRLIDRRCVSLFWALCSVQLIYVSCFCASTILFWVASNIFLILLLRALS